MSKREERKKQSNGLAFLENLGRSVGDVTYAQTDAQLEAALAQLSDEAEYSINAALVEQRGHAVHMGKFQVSHIGLYIDGEVSEGEWLAFIEGVKRITSALQWIIGDLIAYGESTIGKSYDEMAPIFGKSPDTLKVYVSICRAYPFEDRFDGAAKFAHHQIVAFEPNHEVRRNWLRLVRDKGLSVDELRRQYEGMSLPHVPILANKKNRAAFNRLWRAVSGDADAVSSKDIEQIERWLAEIKHTKRLT